MVPGIYRLVLLLMAAGLISCGGSGGAGSPDTPTSITFTIIPNGAGGTGPPVLALQTDTAGFKPVSIQNNQLTFILPSATTKFAIAMDCFEAETSDDFETIFEATPQDGTSFTAGCERSPAVQPAANPAPLLGTATGSVDASAIPNATAAEIFGNGPLPGVLSSALTGTFSASMPVGTDDFAVVAFGPLGVLAVKILPGQTVPGAIDGGNTVTLSSADMLGTQPLNITGLPAGFLPGLVFLNYKTAGGTKFPFTANGFLSDPTQYPTVPAGATQSGDNYQFQVTATDANHSTVSIAPSISNGGGPVTLGPFPSPSSFSVQPATLPSFAFDTYSGFAGQMPSQEGAISWIVTTILPPNVFHAFLSVHMTATASFLNGATSMTLPDLTAIPDFLSLPASGTTVTWTAGLSVAGSNSAASVSNMGTFTAP